MMMMVMMMMMKIYRRRFRSQICERNFLCNDDGGDKDDDATISQEVPFTNL